MLEGFHFDISTAQAHDHFLNRATFHDAKEQDYRAKLAALGAINLAVENQSYDPKRDLEQKAEDHRRRASMFRFRAEYLAPDETFRLEERDLITLEFLDRYA